MLLLVEDRDPLQPSSTMRRNGTIKGSPSVRFGGAAARGSPGAGDFGAEGLSDEHVVQVREEVAKIQVCGCVSI
jgi:hypothetical protein